MGTYVAPTHAVILLLIALHCEGSPEERLASGCRSSSAGSKCDLREPAPHLLDLSPSFFVLPRHLRGMKGITAGLCGCGCGQSPTLRHTAATSPVRPWTQPKRTLSHPEGWIEQGMRFVWIDGKKRPLHRLIMERELGRPLRSDEIVLHRDGDLLNNEPS